MLSWIPYLSWWSMCAWKVNWTCFLTKQVLKLYKNELCLVKCKYIGQALENKYLFKMLLLWVLFELQTLSKNSVSSSLFSPTDRYFFICFGSFWSWRMTVTGMHPVLALLLFLSHDFMKCFRYWLVTKNMWEEWLDVIFFNMHSDKLRNVSKLVGSCWIIYIPS